MVLDNETSNLIFAMFSPPTSSPKPPTSPISNNQRDDKKARDKEQGSNEVGNNEKKIDEKQKHDNEQNDKNGGEPAENYLANDMSSEKESPNMDSMVVGILLGVIVLLFSIYAALKIMMRNNVEQDEETSEEGVFPEDYRLEEGMNTLVVGYTTSNDPTLRVGNHTELLSVAF